MPDVPEEVLERELVIPFAVSGLLREPGALSWSAQDVIEATLTGPPGAKEVFASAMKLGQPT